MQHRSRVLVGIVVWLALIGALTWFDFLTAHHHPNDTNAEQPSQAIGQQQISTPFHAFVGWFADRTDGQITAVATAVIAAFTVVLAWIGRLQFKDARIIQRAYLSVEPRGIETDMNGAVIGQIAVVNKGRLPARKVTPDARIDWDNGRDRNKFDEGKSATSYQCSGSWRRDAKRHRCPPRWQGHSLRQARIHLRLRESDVSRWVRGWPLADLLPQIPMCQKFVGLHWRQRQPSSSPLQRRQLMRSKPHACIAPLLTQDPSIELGSHRSVLSWRLRHNTGLVAFSCPTKLS